jgi:hypothetical protein
LLTRKSPRYQLSLFVATRAMHCHSLCAEKCACECLNAGPLSVAVGLVSLAEPLNTFASRHWHLFASQNYFDRHGVFVSVVYSGPLLLVALVIVVAALLTTADLLVVVKRAELRHSVGT